MALAALVLGAGQAQAQATITGKVTDSNAQPLGGAQVLIRELASFGATTASNGTYTIVVPADRSRGQSMTLVARYLGKAPSTRAITLNAGNQEVNFALRDDPLRLDELVVTGVNTETSTKKLAFAVGKVSSDQLQETPGVTALSGLAGKVAGVRVVTASGEPGSAPSIRLRGATSITGSQEPLIIIDGTISRATLADISSEDIDRIEVIKGAAASSLYGSDAANGVVQIFTKRGKSLADGKLLVTIRNEGGASFLGKRIANGNAHAFQIEPDPANPGGIRFKRDAGGNRVPEADGIADNKYPIYYDQQDLVIKPGLFYTNYLSIGQRRGATNFNASFQNTSTEGVIFGLKGFSRQNFRLNVDQQLTPRVDLEMSTFYGRSNNNDTPQGTGAPFFQITFVEPFVDLFAKNPDGTPYAAKIPDRLSNAANPLYNLANQKRDTERSRFTGGGRLRWRMLDWLTAEANYNFDQERSDFTDFVPFGYLGPTGTATDGSLFKQAFTGRTYNTGATLTASGSWSGINNTTKIAYVYEDQTASNVTAYADQLIVKNVPEYAGADPSTFNATSNNQTIRNRNAFAITTFDIKDKYILDGLIRRDESSLFGPDARKSYYGRVSGAWRANEDLKIKGFDEIRLRASYGTAGLRPRFQDQYEVLSTGGGSFAKAQLGNRNLKPAHSAELEVGGNVEMGGGRFTLEYTYSRKTTRDQIQLVNLPSVVGFTQQWQNVGSLRSNTHELAMGLQVVNNRDMAWVVNLTADRTRQQITDYPLPETLNSFGQQPAVFFLGQGAKLGIMYGNRAVRTIAEIYDDPAKAACRATTCGDATFVVNEEGYVVPVSTYRTVNEKPFNYVKCNTFNTDGTCKATTDIVEIGDANPDFNMSFSSTFNYKRFSVTGLLDWTQGGNIYNGTRQWPFQDRRDPIFDQSAKPEAAKKPIAYYSYFYNGLNGQALFVEPGTYAKIKELSVNYTLVRDQLRKLGLGRLENVRLGIVGRNLFTFTKYSGYDPEVSGIQGDPYQFRMDWFQYPHFRTFTGVVEIAF